MTQLTYSYQAAAYQGAARLQLVVVCEWCPMERAVPYAAVKLAFGQYLYG